MRISESKKLILYIFIVIVQCVELSHSKKNLSFYGFETIKIFSFTPFLLPLQHLFTQTEILQIHSYIYSESQSVHYRR